MKKFKLIPLVCLVMSAVMLFSSCGSTTASESKPTTSSDTGCAHTFGEWENIKQATCISNGSQTHVCTKCGFKETKLTPVDKHVEETVKGWEATCTEAGLSDGIVCTACKTVIQEQTPIAALGHRGKSTVIKTATLYEGEVVEMDCDHCSFSGRIENEKVSPESVGLPVVYIDGDISKISKNNEVNVSVTYNEKGKNFSAYATLKHQGSSSLAYDKKNYTIKFYEDEAHTDKYKVDLGWGKESKYCLKANYIDYSHARNIVSARLFSDIVDTRKNKDKNLDNAPNNGVVDGYPILIYINGTFEGIYTMNIPKDNWMFGIKKDDSKKQAILMAEHWEDSTYLEAEINAKYSNWDLEYCSTEDTAWVRNSFNEFIRFINENDGQALKNGLGKYIDVESAIDTMLFTLAMNGRDNTGKNMIYVTYDGKKWILSMYDMDSTWGMHWEGTKFYEPGDLIPKVQDDGTISHWIRYNLLWDKLMQNYVPEIKARYKQLRGSILDAEYIKAEFEKFMNEIPEVARRSELQRWKTLPSTNSDHLYQIYSFAYGHLKEMDAFIEKLK